MSTGHEMTDYSLRIAQRHVEMYSNQDSLMTAQHRDAMECRACEEFLSLGIGAYKWIRQADETLREAARQGFEVPEEAVNALRLLYRRWLTPCRRASKLIDAQKANGFLIGNLGEFNAACEYVRSQVRRQEDYAVLDEVMQGKSFDAAFWQEAARIRSAHS